MENQMVPTDSVDPGVLLRALTSLKKGDFSARLPLEWVGVAGKIADAFNDVAEQADRLLNEVERVSVAVGREGKLAERADIGDVVGGWG